MYRFQERAVPKVHNAIRVDFPTALSRLFTFYFSFCTYQSMIVKYRLERISLYKYSKYQQKQPRNSKQSQQRHQSHHQLLTLV